MHVYKYRYLHGIHVFLQGFETKGLEHADIRSLAVMALNGDFPEVPGPAQNAIEETLQEKVPYILQT